MVHAWGPGPDRENCNVELPSPSCSRPARSAVEMGEAALDNIPLCGTRALEDTTHEKLLISGLVHAEVGQKLLKCNVFKR